MPFATHLRLAAVSLALLSCSVAVSARADFKAFAHIYPYFTQPAGGMEVEVWNGLETGNLGRLAQSTLLQEQVEVEYGITDHWDVSLYSVLEQAPSELAGVPAALTFDAFQVETRYRFAEKGQWPVDTELYAEVERPIDLRQPFEGEFKLILEKDVHKLFFQLNLIDAEQLASGPAFGYDLAAHFGVGYEIRPWIRVGVEALENYQVDPTSGSSAPQETVHVGPSLALAGPRFWVVITPAFRVAGQDTIDEVGNDLRLRVIFGLEF